MQEARTRSRPEGRSIPPVLWLLLGLLLVAGYFLVGEHRPHVVALLPFLFLFVCPLMHLLHRHGHGRHDVHRGGAR